METLMFSFSLLLTGDSHETVLDLARHGHGCLRQHPPDRHKTPRVKKMQTEKNLSVKEIFQAIKHEKGFKKNTELAAFAGVSKQSLKNWEDRNSIGNYEAFTSKGLSEYFMRTGRGPMFSKDISMGEAEKNANDSCLAEGKSLNPLQGSRKAFKILSGGTDSAKMLHELLGFLDKTSETEEEMGRIEELMKRFLEENEALRKSIDENKKAIAELKNSLVVTGEKREASA
jgi:DNA-binding transcriptional regulator YiaG